MIRKALILSSFILLCFTYSVAQVNYLPIDTSNLNRANNVTCDSSLWAHVYDPDRLILLQHCIEVTGIVWETPTKEGDGDYHIMVRLDSGQNFYLNSKNYKYKDSCLVVEAVCAVENSKHKGRVKTTLFYRLLYADLEESCENYFNNVYIPKKGEHIKIIGPLIIDAGEYSLVPHGWQEIHPVNKIEVIP